MDHPVMLDYPATMRRCDTCKHYRQVGEAKVCARFPPVPQMVGVGPGELQTFTVYPAPLPHWTCGEHAPKLAS